MQTSGPNTSDYTTQEVLRSLAKKWQKVSSNQLLSLWRKHTTRSGEEEDISGNFFVWF